MINYGIQIDDLKGFTDDPVPFVSITENVEACAMKLLSKAPGRDSDRSK